MDNPGSLWAPHGHLSLHPVYQAVPRQWGFIPITFFAPSNGCHTDSSQPWPQAESQLLQNGIIKIGGKIVEWGGIDTRYSYIYIYIYIPIYEWDNKNIYGNRLSIILIKIHKYIYTHMYQGIDIYTD